eukprot:g45314.t1
MMAGWFAMNNGLFEVRQLFKGELWREVLDDEEYSIRYVLHVSSVDIVVVFHCGMSELSIVVGTLLSCPIGNTQHRFMKGRSCLTKLVEFFEDITCMVDNGEPLDVVYLDFQKAF